MVRPVRAHVLRGASPLQARQGKLLSSLEKSLLKAAWELRNKWTGCREISPRCSREDHHGNHSLQTLMGFHCHAATQKFLIR